MIRPLSILLTSSLAFWACLVMWPWETLVAWLVVLAGALGLIEVIARCDRPRLPVARARRSS